ncbi:MAG: exodeoxyribonuclease VII small subunit [Kiritimatiellia bacterium]|nr:exodeoxyribonuclease VII small subunit [Lentisphaerota bacterium]
MSSEKKTAPKPDFEKSLERLEKIVEEMEEGSLSLEKMMRHFEDGMQLINFCSHKLSEVEQKIEMLIKQNDAEKLVPFHPQPDNRADTLEATTNATDV